MTSWSASSPSWPSQSSGCCHGHRVSIAYSPYSCTLPAGWPHSRSMQHTHPAAASYSHKNYHMLEDASPVATPSRVLLPSPVHPQPAQPATRYALQLAVGLPRLDLAHHSLPGARREQQCPPCTQQQPWHAARENKEEKILFATRGCCNHTLTLGLQLEQLQ